MNDFRNSTWIVQPSVIWDKRRDIKLLVNQLVWVEAIQGVRKKRRDFGGSSKPATEMGMASLIGELFFSAHKIFNQFTLLSLFQNFTNHSNLCFNMYVLYANDFEPLWILKHIVCICFVSTEIWNSVVLPFIWSSNSQ